jgi:hypothetical protein
VPYGDIEGVWTFIHFSYSEKKRKAIAFIRYGHKGLLKKIEFEVAHLPMDTYAKFILGGTHVRYLILITFKAQIILGIQWLIR